MSPLYLVIGLAVGVALNILFHWWLDRR